MPDLTPEEQVQVAQFAEAAVKGNKDKPGDASWVALHLVLKLGLLPAKVLIASLSSSWKTVVWLTRWVNSVHKNRGVRELTPSEIKRGLKKFGQHLDDFG